MNLVTVPLLGLAPDLDPTQQGAFSYCSGMEPTLRGWRAQRSVTGPYTSAAFNTGSFILDGFVSEAQDGTEVFYVVVKDATAVKYKILLNIAGTLTDKSVAGSYTVAGVENFSFCQFGNITTACNLVDAVQTRDASGSSAFANSTATGIPKAKLCVTWGPPSGQRVMLLHYNDGTEYQDGWWSSHNGGPTAAWTPDVATGAANGRLLGAGKIRCGIAYRDDIVVFGDRQMWLGRFVGPPFVVEWTRISDEIGCCGPYAATTHNGVLYFVGKQGLFSFDGSFPQRVPVPIQEELVGIIDQWRADTYSANERLIQITSDDEAQIIRLTLRDNVAAAMNIVNTYSISSRTWRVGNRKQTWDIFGSGNLSVTCSLERRYWVVMAADFVVHVLLEGTSNQNFGLSNLVGFGLHYLGANKGDTYLSDIIPRFTQAPQSFQLVNYYGPSMSETLANTTAAVTVSATPWRADVRQTARWHAPRLYFNANSSFDYEVIDVMAAVQPAGKS